MNYNEVSNKLSKISSNNVFDNNIYNLEIFKNGFKTIKNKLILLCILSALLYEYTNDILVNNLCNQWELIHDIVEVDNLVYGIFHTEEYIVISFKGTSTFEDVISDITVIQIDDKYSIPGKIHKGFHDMILGNNVCEDINNSINKLILDNDKIHVIYITGHSMGASISSIMYAYLKVNTKIKLELITYGCPKVGNKQFSKTSDKTNTIRVINGNDLITKVPYSLYGFLNYVHPQNRLDIGKKTTCFYSIEDHHILNYYNSLINL